MKIKTLYYKLLCKIFGHKITTGGYYTKYVVYNGPLNGKSIRLQDYRVEYCVRCNAILKDEQI